MIVPEGQAAHFGTYIGMPGTDLRMSGTDLGMSGTNLGMPGTDSGMTGTELWMRLALHLNFQIRVKIASYMCFSLRQRSTLYNTSFHTILFKQLSQLKYFHCPN